MKKFRYLFYTLFSLLVFSTPSLGYWELVTKQEEPNKIDFYVSPKVVREGNIVSFLFLLDFHKKNEFGDSSYLIEVNGDCSNNKTKHLLTLRHPERMGKGKYIKLVREPVWMNLDPDGIENKVLKYVCNGNK